MSIQLPPADGAVVLQALVAEADRLPVDTAADRQRAIWPHGDPVMTALAPLSGRQPDQPEVPAE